MTTEPDATLGLEARADGDDHLSLRLWLRLLACSTQIETEIRRRLRSRFDTTLARFDYLAQLHRHPEGLAHERAVALPDGHRRQHHRPDRPAAARRPGAARDGAAGPRARRG